MSRSSFLHSDVPNCEIKVEPIPTKPINSIYGPVQAFRDLWQDINDQDSWEANPYVWVIKFKKVVAQ